MKKNYKSICVVDTVYSLMLYLLLGKYDISETYFYFSSGIPKELRKKFCHSYLLKSSKSNYFSRCYVALRNYLVFNISFKSKKLTKLDVYGHDHLAFSRLFLSKAGGNIYLIEDGYANYDVSNYSEDINDSPISIIKRKFFRFKPYPKFGLSPRVKGVFLTGAKPIPEIIKDKVYLKKLESLWQNLNQSKQTEILKVFGVPDPSLFKEKQFLLITQCFSENYNYISENQKINFYKKIIDGIDMKNLIIKPHPREYTDYRNFFQNACVLNKVFPLELIFLSCSNTSITDVFSVDSSCLTMISSHNIRVHTYDRAMIYEEI